MNNNNFVICQNCGEANNTSDSICRKCGQPLNLGPILERKTKKVTNTIIIILSFLTILLFAILIIEINSNNNNEIITVNRIIDTSLSEETTIKEDNISVGNYVETNSFKIAFLSCDKNSKDYNIYADIKSGYKIVKAEFEIENITQDDRFVGSFECYADGVKCEEFYSGNDFNNACLEKFSAGRKIKATLYYSVPLNSESIEIEYTDSYWENSHIIFSFN